MVDTVVQSQQSLRFAPRDQSIWNNGAAEQIRWSEYFPLIGGDRLYFGVDDLRITQGEGRVTLDGERITYDPEGAYASLPAGETRAITVAYTLVGADGTRLGRTVEIEARGLTVGTGFAIPATGIGSGGALSFAAADAATILADPHVFDSVTIIDVGFDTRDVADAATSEVNAALDRVNDQLNQLGSDYSNAQSDLQQATERLAPYGRYAEAQASVLPLLAAFETANGAYTTANDAFSAYQRAEVGKLAADTALAAALQTFEAADQVLTAARTATSFAFDLLREAQNVIQEISDLVLPFLLNNPLLPLSAALSFFGVTDRYQNAISEEARLEIEIPGLEDAEEDAQSAFAAADAELLRLIDVLQSAITLSGQRFDEYTAALGGRTLDSLRFARDATQRELTAAEGQRDNARDEITAQIGPASEDRILNEAARIGLEIADITARQAAIGSEFAAREVERAALEAARQTIELALDDTQIAVDLQQTAEIAAQLGLQVDFELDAGSVDANIDLRLTTTGVHDIATDTLTFEVDAVNATTGQSVAFDTTGPSFNLYAGFVHNFDITVESALQAIVELVGFELFPEDVLRSVDRIETAGWIDIVDMDSSDLSYSFNLPVGADWITDILTIEVAAPVIEAEGTAATPRPEMFTDPTFFNIDEIAALLVDLANLRLDFSPEFRALLQERGAVQALDDRALGEAVSLVAGALLDTIAGQGDTDGDGVVPLFLVDGADTGVNGLIHLNTIADNPPADLESVGRYGFFYAQQQSNDVLRVSVDIDQLIATAINVLLGNSPASTVNPLSFEIDLFDLQTSAPPRPGQSEASDLVDVNIGLDLLDLDASAGINFSQKFALSLDDLAYTLRLEDGTAIGFAPGEKAVFEGASGLQDTNGNGVLDYRVEVAPSSTFFNDTQIGLSLGYQLDLLQVMAELVLNVPLDDYIPDVDIPDIRLDSALNFGPVLRVAGDIDALSADVFEDSFAFNIGRAVATGSLAMLAEPIAVDGIGTGTNGTEILIGGASADRIAGGGGGDRIDGGDGDDTLFGDGFSGGFAEAIFGSVFRLYLAALGRGPDRAGINDWVTHLLDGTVALPGVAAGFTQSAEFQTRFGTLDNTGYVELLYSNVLDRDPSPAETAAWLANMANGWSRVDVLLGFSESREFIIDSAGAMALALDALDPATWSGDVYRLYRASLDREPDLTGFAGWITFLADGTDIEETARRFGDSAEFIDTYGELTPGQYVELLYRNVLNRDSSADERQAWVDLMDAGRSTAQVLLGFSNSQEFIRNTAPDLVAWMRSQPGGDTLNGGGGANDLIGGDMADRFVFEADRDSLHRVHDLEAWDWLVFQGFGYGDAAAARAEMQQVDTDVVFAARGVVVQILDTQLSQITDDMIIV
ncbi:MAG: DUF4214 domain-containing protein [Rhodobacteraceae bacterium]|nr:DUF4214 domain-containing protein [Paracoccaceae bacterium]